MSFYRASTLLQKTHNVCKNWHANEISVYSNRITLNEARKLAKGTCSLNIQNLPRVHTEYTNDPTDAFQKNKKFAFANNQKKSKTRRKLRKTLAKTRKTKDSDEKSSRKVFKILMNNKVFCEWRAVLKIHSICAATNKKVR